MVVKIVILTDERGKVVGASMANGDERAVANISNLVGAGLTSLRLHVVDADSLSDLGKFVASEVREAEELATES